MLKKQRIIDKGHLQWIATLPCLVTGKQGQTQAHHLLRGGYRGTGMKNCDSFVIPLHYIEHLKLHADGNETRWLAERYIDDPSEVAAKLYEYTRDDWEAKKYLRTFENGQYRYRMGILKKL